LTFARKRGRALFLYHSRHSGAPTAPRRDDDPQNVELKWRAYASMRSLFRFGI
jgi:hypothetical protein